MPQLNPSLDPNNVTFAVDVKGNVTGELYVGKFTFKKRLSFREQLACDNRRRELLGPALGEPTIGATSSSIVFSQLFIRLVDAPSWWTNHDNGLELLDDNVVAAVYRPIADEIKAQNEQADKDAEKAQTDLKSASASDQS